MTTSTVVYESELGTLSSIEGGGIFRVLRLNINSPATLAGYTTLVRQARSMDYHGMLQPVDFYADGSERWVIYPETADELVARIAAAELVTNTT